MPVSLQPDSELVEAFKFFDSNSDNVLTKDEFATMIRSLGKYTPQLRGSNARRGGSAVARSGVSREGALWVGCLASVTAVHRAAGLERAAKRSRIAVAHPFLLVAISQARPLRS